MLYSQKKKIITKIGVYIYFKYFHLYLYRNTNTHIILYWSVNGLAWRLNGVNIASTVISRAITSNKQKPLTFDTMMHHVNSFTNLHHKRHPFCHLILFPRHKHASCSRTYIYAITLHTSFQCPITQAYGNCGKENAINGWRDQFEMTNSSRVWCFF